MRSTSMFCLATLLLFLLVSLGCKREKVKVSEVEERIDKNILPGSTKEQVLDFLGSLKVNSIKVEHTEYIPKKPIGTDELKDPKTEVYGYIVAWMKNTGSDLLQVYNIRIVFYFDRLEHLILYRVESFGDW